MLQNYAIEIILCHPVSSANTFSKTKMVKTKYCGTGWMAFFHSGKETNVILLFKHTQTHFRMSLRMYSVEKPVNLMSYFWTV